MMGLVNIGQHRNQFLSFGGVNSAGSFINLINRYESLKASDPCKLYTIAKVDAPYRLPENLFLSVPPCFYMWMGVTNCAFRVCHVFVAANKTSLSSRFMSSNTCKQVIWVQNLRLRLIVD